MNQTAALQGDALYALLDRAQELLNDYDDDSATISREERMAAAAELLEQQTFAPASVTELERLHDFLDYLGHHESASRLLQTHMERVLAAGPDARQHEHLTAGIYDNSADFAIAPITADFTATGAHRFAVDTAEDYRVLGQAAARLGDLRASADAVAALLDQGAGGGR